MRRARDRFKGHLGALALLGLTLGASPALAQRPDPGVGPRPVQLTDLTPRPSITIGALYGRPGELSGLAFPIQLAYPIERSTVFALELPFGYLNARGENASPRFGNVGVGLRYSRFDRLARRWGMRYGAALTGRLPTSPDLDAEPPHPSRLRAVTPYTSERWSPETAFLRVDGSVALQRGRFAGQLEAGGTAALPMDDDPATVSGHYGLMLGGRLGAGLWLFGELVGTELAPGTDAALDGHVITFSPGLRLATGGVAPAFTVSFPLVQPDGFDLPVVLGIEIAAF